MPKRIWSAVFALLLFPAVSQALTYSIVDLGRDLVPTSINNQGQYVARVVGEGGNFTTYIGSNGNLDVNLGSTPLLRINDQGVGFGYDWLSQRTLIYSGGEVSYPAVPSNFIPTDINNSGVIAGYVLVAGPDLPVDTYEAYVYDHGSFTTLTPAITDPNEQTWANAINDLGQAAGRISAGGQIGPALFENGQVTEFGGLDERGDGDAFDINNSGIMVGVALDNERFPVIFQDGSAIRILPDTFTGEAHYINNEGQVVGDAYIGTGGKRTFLYEDGEFSLLEDLIQGFDEEWTLWIRGLNDRGQMVGEVSLGTGEWRGVLLNPNDSSDTPVPTPEPATILLLGSSLAGLAVARMRKQS